MTNAAGKEIFDSRVLSLKPRRLTIESSAKPSLKLGSAIVV
jgi:hypothetical protein